MAIPESEIRDWLATLLPDATITFGTRPAAGGAVPVILSTIYGFGGESEELLSMRIITRGSTYADCIGASTEIFNALHRKNRITLPSIEIYYITGTRPQLIGRDEDNTFLASTNYTVRFRTL